MATTDNRMQIIHVPVNCGYIYNMLCLSAGLAESNGSVPPGLWLTSPAGWLPRTGISSGTLRSAIEYGLALPFLYLSESVQLRVPYSHCSHSMRQGLCNDTVSICLAVPSCAAAAVCGGFAAVGPAGRRYQSCCTARPQQTYPLFDPCPQQHGTQQQTRAVWCLQRCMKLNTDLFLTVHGHMVKIWCIHFYRAMLCIRGTSHGPVSVRPSVCPSVRHKSVFY